MIVDNDIILIIILIIVLSAEVLPAGAVYAMTGASQEAYQPSIETLYSENHPWLQSWLRRRLGDAADAADLAQDVFVRLLFRPPSRGFSHPMEARAYLRKMAGGLCINLWHRREIERAWLEALAAQPEVCAPSAEHQAAILQVMYEMGRVLLSLPRKAATAFLLAVVCGMTDREVAAQLGVTDRMVRKYVAQAMLACMELRLSLAADGEVLP